MNKEIKELNIKAANYSKNLIKVEEEIKKIVIGQDEVIRKTMIALVANGHVLLESVPGLAKTLLVKTFAETISTNFSRIQFTPDLLPADIVGTKIYNHEHMTFETKKGPIFSNIILADEINRAPPKVQSALLEAMQERQVSIQGDTFKLDKPFLVIATQNPIETEGTYKLPEAQVDRFLFKILIEYPNKDDEKIIIRENSGAETKKVNKIITPKELIEIQEFSRLIYADEKIEEYVASIIDATRNPAKYKIDIDGQIEFGASPRASIGLVVAAKANALFNGRGYVIPEDVKEIAYEVLRHRILLTYEAEAEDVTTKMIIEKILQKIRAP